MTRVISSRGDQPSYDQLFEYWREKSDVSLKICEHLDTMAQVIEYASPEDLEAIRGSLVGSLHELILILVDD